MKPMPPRKHSNPTWVALLLSVSLAGTSGTPLFAEEPKAASDNSAQNQAPTVVPDNLDAAPAAGTEKQQATVWSNLLEAISGKKTSEETEKLLDHVSEISRQGDSFIFVRPGDKPVEFGPDTEYGAHLLHSMTKSERKAKKNFGNDAGHFVHSLAAITLTGNKVDVQRTDADNTVIALHQHRKYIPVRVKELRFGHISLEVFEEKGHYCLKNITGITAVIGTPGLDLPIELREFSRKKTKAGDTKVTFGITSLVPKPIRNFFHLPDVVSFTYVVKKKNA